MSTQGQRIGDETMSNEVKVFSVKETSEILKTSQQQIRKMIQNQEIAAVKVGREWRITADGLQAFLDSAEMI